MLSKNVNTVQSETADKINKESPEYVTHLKDKYKDVFQDLGSLKDFEVVLHEDPEVKPIIQPQRRIPFHVREQVAKELEKLEAAGIIEPVKGPTNLVSPNVIVQNKDTGDIRICVVMRQPNTAILRTRHPPPTTDDLITELNGAAIFSKLDLKQGYHQLTLAPNSRHLTTFSTHKGLRQYKPLCFGINRAAEIFQNTITQALQGIQNQRNMSDDIIIWGKTQNEQNIALENVLQRLKDKNITLNESKCKFNKSKLAFFGLIFQKEGVSTDSRLVEDFNNLETPRSVEEVRSLLKMAQYSAKFIQDYSTITEPLRTLTHKNTTFKWDTPQQTVFDTLKEVLCTHPVMSYFDIKKHTEIVCDASPVGISVILAQKSTKDSEHRSTVAYASRALAPVEQRYSQTEREALAIVWGVERMHFFYIVHPILR